MVIKAMVALFSFKYSIDNWCWKYKQNVVLGWKYQALTGCHWQDQGVPSEHLKICSSVCYNACTLLNDWKTNTLEMHLKRYQHKKKYIKVAIHKWVYAYWRFSDPSSPFCHTKVWTPSSTWMTSLLKTFFWIYNVDNFLKQLL